MKKQASTIAFAGLFTLAVLILGYIMLGLLPMFLFAFGFLGGYILWLTIPTNATFAQIKVPFFLTFAFFILHKFEESYFDFFPRLAEITGVPTPETNSFLVYLLYAFAGAWLLIPFLVKRGYSFGYYLTWTFFTSMGVTELAHFVLPFFTKEPYGYFPGMASVLLLAPTAWWGMWRLIKSDKQN
jgi:hypothetical protein